MAQRLKIGMLTTWNTRCGISEYSRHLVGALRRRDDVSVQVFGSKNYDEYKIAEDEDYVCPTFGVLPWNKYGDHSFDVQNVLDADLDILHVQYEVLLYNQEGFNTLLKELTACKVTKAITYHDNCIPPGFPYYAFDLSYTHREDVGVGEGFVLPMGIEDHKPVVKTFGLGRSRHDIIGEICERNSWTFEYSFGEHEWLSQEDLHRWLRDSDLIVLYYDDTPAAGSSQAIRTAIATRRPVICNDVTWFKDVVSYPQVTKVRTKEDLEQSMHNVLDNLEIHLHSWDKIANMLVEDYRSCL